MSVRSGLQQVNMGGRSGLQPIVGVHNDLPERGAEDAHPIEAITDLQSALDGLDNRLDVVEPMNLYKFLAPANGSTTTLTAADYGTYINYTGMSNGVVNVPVPTASDVGKTIVIYARSAGFVDVRIASGGFYIGQRNGGYSRRAVRNGETIILTVAEAGYYNCQEIVKDGRPPVATYSNISLDERQVTLLLMAGSVSANITLTLPSINNDKLGSAAYYSNSRPYYITRAPATQGSGYSVTLAATGTDRIILPNGVEVSSTVLPESLVIIYPSYDAGTAMRRWHICGLPHNASQIPFTPATSALWDTVPTTAAGALDQLMTQKQNNAYSLNYVAPAADLDGGTTTAGGYESITDSTKTWTVNAYAGKAVHVMCSDGVNYCVAVISSNTATTLVFDDDLNFVASSGLAYRILNTTSAPTGTPSICAFDTTDNDCALVLPDVEDMLERHWIHTYIEAGENHAFVICAGTQRVLGDKYYSLEHRGEAARIYAHNNFPDKDPHWDLLNVEGVAYYAMAYTDADTSITSGSWEYMGTNIVIDEARRFVPITLSGNVWFNHDSIRTKKYRIKWSASITKAAGGTGEVEIAWAHQDRNGTVTYLDTRIGTTRFGATTGTLDVSCETVVTLAGRGEKLIPVARKDAAITASVLAGASIVIQELV